MTFRSYAIFAFTDFYNAMLSERGYGTVGHSFVCLSVRPSATFRYRDYIGWNLEYFENDFTAD